MEQDIEGDDHIFTLPVYNCLTVGIMRQRQMHQSLLCLFFLALFAFSNGFAPVRKIAPTQDSYALGKPRAHSFRVLELQPQFRPTAPALMMSEKPVDMEKQGSFTV